MLCSRPRSRYEKLVQSDKNAGGRESKGMEQKMKLVTEIADAVSQCMPEARVKEATMRAVEEGVDIREILYDGLVAGISRIGEKWKNGEAFIPEVLFAARTMRAGVDIIRNYMGQGRTDELGTILLWTVKGDVHTIGKDLVGTMMGCSGFKVIDLGIDVSYDKVLSAVREHDPNLLGMSALLTTTMLEMKTTIEALKREKVRVPTLVGGAPVSQEFADQIGADGYAPDAMSAVTKAKELLGLL